MKQTVRLLGDVSEFCGTLDENLKLFEATLQVITNLRDSEIEIEGDAARVAEAARVVSQYNELVQEGHALGSTEVKSLFRMAAREPEATLSGAFSPMVRAYPAT